MPPQGRKNLGANWIGFWLNSDLPRQLPKAKTCRNAEDDSKARTQRYWCSALDDRGSCRAGTACPHHYARHCNHGRKRWLQCYPIRPVGRFETEKGEAWILLIHGHAVSRRGRQTYSPRCLGSGCDIAGPWEPSLRAGMATSLCCWGTVALLASLLWLIYLKNMASCHLKGVGLGTGEKPGLVRKNKQKKP